MNAIRKNGIVGISLVVLTLASSSTRVLAQETTPPMNHRTATELLAEARVALDRGDLVRAESLVSQTEDASLSYPLLHRGDTPAKVRRDLDRARQAGTVPQELPKPTSSDNRYAEKPLAAPTTGSDPLATARRLVSSAQAALAAGNVEQAEILAFQASDMNLPEEAFAANETSPGRLAWMIQQARYRRDSGVVTAGGEAPMGPGTGAQQALHIDQQDTTLVQPAAAIVGPAFEAMLPEHRTAQISSPFESVPAAPSGASELLAEGEQAFRDHDLEAAYDLFRKAAKNRNDLSDAEIQRLEGHLRMLSATPAQQPNGLPAPENSMIDRADADQQVLARQLATSVGQTQVESRSLRKSEPRRSLELLEEVKGEIEKSNLNAQYRDQLTRRVDRSVAETEKYIKDHRAEIELDEQNAGVRADIDRDRAAKQKVREGIAEHVEQFNTLIDEQRFEEAEVVAMRLKELAPHDPVAQQVWQNAKFIRRNMFNEGVREQRDATNWGSLADVDGATVHAIRDGHEMAYNAEVWGDLEKRSALSEKNSNRNEREIEIERRLKTPVQLRYDDRPLGEVLDALAEMAGINIHLDPRGLNQEGVTRSTPVSINLSSEVSLKSALNLILEPLHLGYSIKDEVLKVTSETLRDGDVYLKIYYVADLVIPIPNFVPSNNIGLQGLINDAMASAGTGALSLNPQVPIAMSNDPRAVAPEMGADGAILPQNFSGGGLQTGAATQPLSTGPGGLGGAASADFDSLIDLIVSTVASDTWAENGGVEAEIRPFATNLSLVVSQTQAVHEEIADLLEQLRRLQDLQVTIEVRFIRLSDDFFERIGIDFDLNINDNTNTFNDIALGAAFEGPRSGGVVGAQAPIAGDLATVTADLDIPFRQGSFDVAVPSFGGFNPTQAATFGFAILSDIEAYFLINAAQGDSRTNVLNAPKVTLFNGQQAFVSDTSQSPFVISVIPVVGEFAAAQQPVIVVLSEGTLMSIQAVVSNDRRYVRLTVVPFFSEIGDVDTFTFDGQTTTNNSSSSSSTDADDDGTNEAAANSSNGDTIIAGTTVQLPTFQFVSVTTTVSVPDGGTVLLGGIKRLSEGREEFGVPLLSKIPYINRLFRNVGIGRETNSLMMMVTPRIIIQEEEEERLGLTGQ